MLSNSVRLGVFRDRPVFEVASFGEIIVPAHIAAFAGDGLWGFLQGIATLQNRRDSLFRYDPMTYLLYIPRRYWVRESAQDDRGDDDPVSLGDLRPALSSMLEAYGLLEPAVLRSVSAARREFVSNGAQLCLAFQRRGSEASKTQAIAKYARLLGRPVDGALVPSRLVAPYAAIDAWDGPAFEDQVELNASALRERVAGEKLWAVLAITSSEGPVPSSTARTRLQLASFDGIGLWLGGLDEYTAPVATLAQYRRLVTQLERPVWVLFGGYFSLLLARDGVEDVSHGVFYTESKLVRGAVGSGPAPDRYYIPRLHRFYDPARAFAVIRLLPDYACDCPHCGDIQELEASLVAAGRDTTQRIAWTQRLQRHFLTTRANEVSNVARTDIRVQLAELVASARDVEAIPEVDRNDIGLSAAHLRRWIGALS